MPLLTSLALLVPAVLPQGSPELEIVWTRQGNVLVGTQPGGELVARTVPGVEILDLEGNVASQITSPIPGSTVIGLVSGRIATAGIIGESDPGFPPANVPSGDDIGVTVFEVDGTEAWRARVGSAVDDRAVRLSPTGDGGLIVSTLSVRTDLGAPGVGPLDKPFVARLDAAGAVSWSTTVLGSLPAEQDHLNWGVAPLSGGGALVSSTWIDQSGTAIVRSSGWTLAGNGQVVEFRENAPGILEAFPDLQGGTLLTENTAGGRTTSLVNGSGTELWNDDSLACSSLAIGVTADGSSWTLASVPVTPLAPCPPSPFGSTRRVLQRIDGSGMLVETFELPAGGVEARIARGGQVYVRLASGSSSLATIQRLGPIEDVSALLCEGELNSLVRRAGLGFAGDPLASNGYGHLFADDLPPGVTVLFLASFTTGFTPNPGGSRGNLCLGGAIGRFSLPGQIRTSGQDRRANLAFDLAELPSPTGLVTVQAGETVHFQGWYRDVVAMTVNTSNLTDAISVTFR